jgi:hypothetical protein
MTESEWLSAKKPRPCEEIAREFGDARKLRLLMVGYLEPLQEVFSAGAKGVFLMLREWAEGERKAIEDRPWSAPDGPLGDYMERSPKGLASDAVGWVVHHGSKIDPHRTYDIAMPAADVMDRAAQALVLNRVGKSPPKVSITHPSFQAWSQAWQSELQALQAKQADLMRCVYGNPYRPVAIAPEWPRWKDGTVRNIAQDIYDERAFDRLPILADALEEAGCANRDVLNHCRSDAAHARGCWVVDLILNKK